MAAQKYDPEYARGSRAPGPVPTKSAWADVLKVRKGVLGLERLLEALLRDYPELGLISSQLDQIGAHAESLVLRYDRVGIPEDQSEIRDMEGALRLADKYPEQFKAFDVAGLKKRAIEVRRKGAA